MKSRGRWKAGTALFALVVAWTTGGQVTGQDRDELRAKAASVLGNEELRKQLTAEFLRYERQLQAVLKTRFPEEKAFVEAIVLQIQNGSLPQSVVDSAWLWVRTKRPTTRYPFVYFERVLRLEAEKLDLFIPPYDLEIYNRANEARSFQPPGTIIRR